jgi:hypothetical protein
MDNPFDWLDVLDLADATGQAADSMGHLGDLVDAIDYLPLDSTDVAALTDLSGFDFVDATANADVVVDLPVADWSAVDLGGPDLTDFPLEHADSALDNAFIEALQSPVVTPMADYVSSAMAEYPEHLLAGLDHIDVDVDPVDGLLGSWDLQPDGTCAISLWNHVQQLPETLHHELGHHIFNNHPDMEESIAQFMDSSRLMHSQGLGDFLDLYPEHERPAEFAAQVFSFYQTKPDLLKIYDPELFSMVDQWWHSVSPGAV